MGDDSGRQDSRVAGQLVSLEGEAWREGRVGLIEAKGVHLPIVGLEHDAPEPLLSPTRCRSRSPLTNHHLPNTLLLHGLRAPSGASVPWARARLV
jgi:hypothetical protein